MGGERGRREGDAEAAGLRASRPLHTVTHKHTTDNKTGSLPSGSVPGPGAWSAMAPGSRLGGVGGWVWG